MADSLISYLLTIPKENWQDFLNTKAKSIASMGSPAWLLRSSRIREALDAGVFDQDQPHAALTYLADLFDGLNEHNRTMASAAVDVLPLAQRQDFLKKNLNNFGDVCSNIIEQVRFSRPILERHANSRGLSLPRVDFSAIDYYPKKPTARGRQR